MKATAFLLRSHIGEAEGSFIGLIGNGEDRREGRLKGFVLIRMPCAIQQVSRNPSSGCLWFGKWLIIIFSAQGASLIHNFILQTRDLIITAKSELQDQTEFHYCKLIQEWTQLNQEWLPIEE